MYKEDIASGNSAHLSTGRGSSSCSFSAFNSSCFSLAAALLARASFKVVRRTGVLLPGLVWGFFALIDKVEDYDESAFNRATARGAANA